MGANKIEFAFFGNFDYFSILRSNMPIDVNSTLPMPIGTTKTMQYFDEDVQVGNTYYYRVIAHVGSESFISDEQIRINVTLGDEYWNSVEVLLQGNAASYPSTNIHDYSKNNNAVTVTSATIINTDKKYNEGAIKFSSATASKVVTNIAELGTSDFTLECWFKASSLSDGCLVLGVWTDNDYTNGIAITSTGSLQLAVMTSTSSSANGIGYAIRASTNTAIIADTWTHLCVMKKSSQWYFFIDGVYKGTSDFAASRSIKLRQLQMGRSSWTGNSHLGSYNDVRLTKIARYAVTGFTPPDKEFYTN